jgi:hypothetical protein
MEKSRIQIREKHSRSATGAEQGTTSKTPPSHLTRPSYARPGIFENKMLLFIKQPLHPHKYTGKNQKILDIRVSESK